MVKLKSLSCLLLSCLLRLVSCSCCSFPKLVGAPHIKHKFNLACFFLFILLTDAPMICKVKKSLFDVKISIQMTISVPRETIR